MKNLDFVIVALLLLEAIKVNGESQNQFLADALDLKGRLLTPAEGCGYSKVQNTRIIGGTPAKVGAWPWLALLGYKIRNEIKFACGGSLITSRHVLSAAHCCFPTPRIVRLGEHDISTEDDEHQDILVAGVERHEDFSIKWKINDIAIVYLQRDVDFNDRIRPICLPITEDLLNRRFIGLNPFLAGWGTVSSLKNELSNVPMQVQVPIITNKKCKKSYAKFDGYEEDFQFDDRIVCAGFDEGGKDSCKGDSGGPLMLPLYENGSFPFYLVGVISHAEGCAIANVPGVNTNVQYFAKWIEEKLAMEIDGESKSDSSDYEDYY